MRKLEQEQEAAQVDVETAYKASPEKALKVDEEMQQIEEPEGEALDAKSLFS